MKVPKKPGRLGLRFERLGTTAVPFSLWPLASTTTIPFDHFTFICILRMLTMRHLLAISCTARGRRGRPGFRWWLFWMFWRRGLGTMART